MPRRTEVRTSLALVEHEKRKPTIESLASAVLHRVELARGSFYFFHCSRGVARTPQPFCSDPRKRIPGTSRPRASQRAVAWQALGTAAAAGGWLAAVACSLACSAPKQQNGLRNNNKTVANFSWPLEKTLFKFSLAHAASRLLLEVSGGTDVGGELAMHRLGY